jgi:hypothetical protein
MSGNLYPNCVAGLVHQSFSNAARIPAGSKRQHPATHFYCMMLEAASIIEDRGNMIATASNTLLHVPQLRKSGSYQPGFCP